MIKNFLSLTLCAALALGMASCKKDDNNPSTTGGDPAGASNTLTVSDTAYSVTNVYTATPSTGYINLVGTATDNAGMTRIVGVHFPGTALPTTSKTYTIGTDMTPVTMNWVSTGGSYGSQNFGTPGQKVDFVVSGSKKTVKFASLALTSGGTRKLSANYTLQ